MPRALRLTLLVAIPIMLLILLPIGVYGIDRAVSSGNVPRNVSVDGVDIGGATPQDAKVMIETYERDLQSLPATVVVEECTFDRSSLSHKVNLFDMHHKYADVLHLDEALAHLAKLATSARVA